MAEIKIYLDRRHEDKNGQVQVKLYLLHRRQNALVPTGVRIDPSQWDEAKGKVCRHPNAAVLNATLQMRLAQWQRELLLFELKSDLGRMTATEVKNALTRSLEGQDGDAGGDEADGKPAKHGLAAKFREYMASREKPNTKSLYGQTLRHLEKFCGPGLERLRFEDVTVKWLGEFDTHLQKTSPKRNARNVHFRNLRAVFNSAIDEGLTSHYPFRKFKLRYEETAHRSLAWEDAHRVMTMEVEPYQQRYVDAFRLSFILLGMNMVDLCGLTTVRQGRIQYRRAKTGKLYDVRVEPEALPLLSRHRGVEHLVRFGEGEGGYETFCKLANRGLRKLSAHVDWEGPGHAKVRKPLFPDLTTYWARHTWATMAAELDIPKETIAAALGHGTKTVTDIYIRFDQRKVDEAGRRVLDWVLYGKR